MDDLIAKIVKPLKLQVTIVDDDGKPIMWEFPEIGHLPHTVSKNGDFYEVCIGQGGKTLAEAKKWANARFRSWMAREFLDLDAVLALVAAAYADAARRAKNRWALRSEHAAKLFEMDYPDSEIDSKTVSAKADEAIAIADEIEGSTPTNATAALARMLADARAEGMEMAARLADDFQEPGTYQAVPKEFRAGWEDAGSQIAAAIRAMKGQTNDPDR